MIPALLIVGGALVVLAACEAYNRVADAEAELLARRLERQRDAQRG
jgi:hypothetical protein